MAKKATNTVTIEEKLRSLYDLQLIDSKIDQIRDMRGELPLEVEDLEAELSSLEEKLDKIKAEIKDQDNEISNKKIEIKDSQALIKKYEEQQNNVRNNREFEALSKEIEYQNLEIQLCEKRIREYQARIANKNEVLELTQEKYNERKEDLDHKKGELDKILAETKKEEEELLNKSKDFSKNIEERLLVAYGRIRKNMNNGLAVVPVVRGASGGSFFLIPPQRELEIRARKKIIFSEHCGRILVDEELATEEEEKMKELFNKIIKID
jgi:uncharacterized protein